MPDEVDEGRPPPPRGVERQPPEARLQVADPDAGPLVPSPGRRELARPGRPVLPDGDRLAGRTPGRLGGEPSRAVRRQQVLSARLQVALLEERETRDLADRPQLFRADPGEGRAVVGRAAGRLPDQPPELLRLQAGDALRRPVL